MAKNDGWIAVRVSEADKAELERISRDEERSVNGTVRLAIRMLIESRKEAA